MGTFLTVVGITVLVVVVLGFVFLVALANSMGR
jgi:hypothetical protein